MYSFPNTTTYKTLLFLRPFQKMVLLTIIEFISIQKYFKERTFKISLDLKNMRSINTLMPLKTSLTMVRKEWTEQKLEQNRFLEE